MEELLAISFALWLNAIIVGTVIGVTRGSPLWCFLLCLFTGPLGLIACPFIDCRPTCPACGGVWTRDSVGICPHCRTNIVAMRDGIQRQHRSQIEAEASAIGGKLAAMHRSGQG